MGMRTSLKLVRISLGVLLSLSATGFLVQGGLSRYARFGMPPEPHWRWIAIGLIMLGVGAILIRPLPWNSRHSGAEK